MNRRPERRRNPQQEAAKSSFSPTPVRRTNPAIRNAIDESLGGVRFNAQDMRSVMQTVRRGGKRKRDRKKRFLPKLDLVFAFSLLMLVVLPASYFALRGMPDVITVVTGPGEQASPSPAVAAHNEDIVLPTPTAHQPLIYGIGESEAIRLARDCFNAQCDTTIFTFEEYTVDVVLSENAQYIVTLQSIYDNGCSFTVILSADSGELLQYSTPKLATVPAYLNTESEEVRAWYAQYGQFLFAWPQDVQAEFSRRYQGGTLRAAKEGEISYDEALHAVREAAEKDAPGVFTAFYPVLYSERASSDASAHYVVYCYTQEVTDALPAGEPMIVTFDAATGNILSIQGNPLDAAK